MNLPYRLDYDETPMGDSTEEYSEWYPLVHCLVPGCDWTYRATWDALGDDGDVDWNAEHPPHGVPETRCTVDVTPLLRWVGVTTADALSPGPVLRSGDTFTIAPGSITVTVS